MAVALAARGCFHLTWRGRGVLAPRARYRGLVQRAARLARRKYVVSPRDRESTRFPLHVSISSAACQESLQVRSAGAIQDPDNELTDPSTHS